MASFDGGAGPHGAGSYRGRQNYEVVDISSDSGSSYDSSRSRASFVRPCPFQTDRFFDQECSRYFDCPTHTIERLQSDDEAEPNDDSMGSNSPQEEDEDQSHSVHAGESSQQGEEYRRGGDEAGVLGPGPVHIPGAREDDIMTDADERRETIDLTSPGPEPAGRAFDQGASPLPPAVSTAASQEAGPSSGATTSPEIIDLTRDDTPAPEVPMAAAEASSSRLRPPLMQQNLSPADSPGHPGEIVLPRWQPDAEVTLCPICRAQFSFFVRKHHCRKCGRVVCNACSPHRITIPYQYIVLPPEQPRLSAQRYPSSFISSDYADFNNVGGGERVRLCNPCVPDPNIAPPQPLASPTQTSPRSHIRSRSNVGSGFGRNPPPGRFQGYFAAGPGHDPLARHRSVTHSGPGLGAPSSSRGPYGPPYGSTQSRILAGTPPSYFPSSSSAYPGTHSRRYRSMLDVDTGSSSSSRDRALPPPPPPQIAEEDECPVCHRELPSRDLPNFEALRESHITICISSHSAFVSGGTPTGTSQGGSTPPVGTPPPLAMRRTGMFPYVATEKDCVDSAECTICLEEFEVGVRMARLECLCRFHRDCISAWFINHPGRCPVHQHDSFGY